MGQVPTPTHPAPPYIRGVPAKSPTWSFAQAVFKQCTTQNQTADYCKLDLPYKLMNCVK